MSEFISLAFKKLHPNAVTPSYGTNGAAGLDLTAISVTITPQGRSYGTGLAFEIPRGYVGLIFPRSSIYKVDQHLTNCVGVIDSDYRGEVSFKFKTLSSNEQTPALYEPGDRVGQLVLVKIPKIAVCEVGTLTPTDRGAGGFGSTGR